MNFYQHAKTEAVSSICSGKVDDLKILQSDCLKAFWPTCHKKDFPKYFRYRTDSVKFND